MDQKVAIIVGSGGQDGQLLGLHLLSLGYLVIGLTRENIDILDSNAVDKLISNSKPSEIYYLAAYHHSSEDQTIDEGLVFNKSMDIHVRGLINFLSAVAAHSPASRLFYASSSMIYGNPKDEIQTERSERSPCTPYAISKASGMMICKFYREQKAIFASCGILYNHESSLRSPRFVTRKITQAAVKIFKDGGGTLSLGNLDLYVDWGYAPDYVKAMRLILSLSDSDDFIVSTGETHTVREFADLSFKYLGLDYRKFIKVECDILTRSYTCRKGDPSYLKRKTGWRPSVSFHDMVRVLMENELKSYQCG